MSKGIVTESSGIPPAGFLPLLTTDSLFELDLIAENLRLNGIENVRSVPDLFETPENKPILFVPEGKKDQAVSVIATLDLTDFIHYHGQ